MGSFRLGVFAAIITAVVSGCDGGGATETTMPATTPKAPPEAEQIKKDMDKRFQTGPARTPAPTGDTKN